MNLESWIDELLDFLAQAHSSAVSKTRHDNVSNYAKEKLLSKFKEVEKAYGACTNCYGKGYATVNDRWIGLGTDGDIGGYESYVSGGNPNAMKFCKCSRGQQLQERLKEVERQAFSRANTKPKNDQRCADGLGELRSKED